MELCRLTVASPPAPLARRERSFRIHCSSSASSLPSAPLTAGANRRWAVTMVPPPGPRPSRAEAVDYFVGTLARVLGSEKEAQMRMYDASWEGNYGFRCEIDEISSRELARSPGVLTVKPDNSAASGNVSSAFMYSSERTGYIPSHGKNEYWFVQIEKPSSRVVTKSQMVDYCTNLLTKVLGSERDAQVCMYDVSWKNKFNFRCHIDEECAQELASVPGVLSVTPDHNYQSAGKDHIGNEKLEPSQKDQPAKVKTKRLFVTGLSFYTSEKTLREAFEGFGELVEVKIIIDKISKRSKGYAFIEYTTEESAGAALQEMNGKIINGWMIVVDVARLNSSQGRRRS